MEASEESLRVIEKWRNIRLQPNETVVKEFSSGFRMGHIIFFVLSPLTAGIAIPFWMFAAWANSQKKWAVTNNRVLQRSGVFNKRSIIIDKAKITDLEIARPLLAQFFQNGKVMFNTAGSGGRELAITGQSNPDLTADEIREALNI